MDNGVSRRTFLRGAALTSAAGAFAHWTRNPLTALADPVAGQDGSEGAPIINAPDLTTAVTIYVGDDIQSTVNANPPGVTFLLKSTDRGGVRGVHRMQQVIPKNYQSFVGERDGNGNRLTVMAGATILAASAWKVDGIYWRYDNAPLQPGRRVINGHGLKEGNVDDPDAACTRPEDLFVTTNGQCVFLQRVKWKNAVQPGKTWYFDEANRQIFIRDDPNAAGRVIEMSLLKFAFGYEVRAPGRYTPDWPLNTNPEPESAHPDLNLPGDVYAYKPYGVLIQDLIIEKYANPAQTGAIGYFRPGRDWAIIGNETRFNHGSGIKFKGSAVVSGNHTHDNGQFGMEAGDGNRLQEHGGGPQGLEEWGFNGGYAGADAWVEFNVLENNNRLNFNPGWGAGGTKFSQCYRLMVRNNIVRNNKGPGLWTDFSYAGISYIGNVVSENQGSGIFHETSFQATIRDNSVFGNASDNGNYGSQINVAASYNTEVAYNLIMGWKGLHGIIVVQHPQRTVEEYPMTSTNITVHHNEVMHGLQNAGVNGASTSYNWDAFYAPNNIRFYQNRYHCIDPAGLHWRYKDVTRTLADMQAQGQEIGSTVNADRDPSVLAADTGDQLYRYNGLSFVATQGLGVAVEGGYDQRGLHVARTGEVFTIVPGRGWVRLPGISAQDIGASYDGRVVYACGKDGYLYRLQGSRFLRLDVTALRVSVDNCGTVWIVGANNKVYRRDSIWGTFREVKGCLAQDIGAGGGQVYAAGTNEHLYRYSPALDIFQEIQGLGVRVTVQADGNAWHANRAGELYLIKKGGGWVYVGGCIAVDVGA